MVKRYLYPCAGLLMLGGIGTASAQEAIADDIPILVDNLGATVEALGAGLGDVVDTMSDPDDVSAVAVSEAAGGTLVRAGTELVDGTETFGGLGLGFMLVNTGTQNALRPYLRAMDDPSDENIEQAFNPDDLATIAGNLSGVPGALIDSAPDGLVEEGLKPAALQIVRGEPLPAAFLSAAGGVFQAYGQLFDGTNLGSGGEGDLSGPLIAGALVVLVATEGQLNEVHEGIEPLFEATEELRGPAADSLEAVNAEWVEPTLDPLVEAAIGEL